MANNFNKGQLVIDLKVADRLREFFSKRGANVNNIITKVALGDSDIDYHLSNQQSNIKAINAPFQPTGIKHKLIFSGTQGKFTGNITCYVRHINNDGKLSSYYNFPANSQLTQGITVPSVTNGKDHNNITFDILNTTEREGFILFFQTLPDNYYDVNNNPLRLKENYTLNLSNFPTDFELIYDEANQSMLIAKPANYVFQNLIAIIKLTGQFSGLSKTITLNY